MLLTAAIVLIVVVIGGAVSLIIIDMEGRPPGEWFRAVKEWQQTVGALLGFMGAAGVLVLSTELAANQRANQAAHAARAIGYGLALEAEQLASDVSGIMGLVTMIRSQPVPDPNRTCIEFIGMMQRVLPTKTPVYDAVLSHLVDFGDDNLSIFVRFFATYVDLVQEAHSFDTRQCQLNAANEIDYVRGRLRSTLLVYDMIANAYGTIPQEVPPFEEMPTSPPAPAPESPAAVTSTTEPATAMTMTTPAAPAATTRVQPIPGPTVATTASP